MKRKHIYLTLAVLGICYTWYYNIQYFQVGDNPSFMNFFQLAKSNLPGQSLAADLSVVLLTFFVLYIPDAIKLKIKFWWVLIPLTFIIAIAFTFPLYLYLRESALEKLKLEN
ncbi:conserved membrane hypothetical protein [Tenacibaculum maritimum]|uniref:DUF2834 domain-containing protein n=1 Tax=Tenacibaculum maritimum TaxID=107401 RepID=UPI0012E47D38|nr:DUF2834 domain-containing protein [Tenacibaculum maritimum]CAA0189816.1 conserved membrane hypothetical protein [Tenacibaculum maritimum]